ncbi:hypothetical protein [Streptomyces coeruleorubidus]|uniref:hypothetical protein n=1 Tax=Streptomyces coeruleorubidus TaxID=116188 RepID=UPI0033F449AD
MANKRNRPADGYRLPLHVDKARRAAALAAGWRSGPKPPQRRLILAMVGISLLCFGMATVFWLPSQSLVQDLRSRGITSAATVIDVDSKPKYVTVRLASGPRAGDEVKLSEYAGMQPDAQVNETLLVTYDPKQTSQILSRGWVEDPPPNLPAYGTAALAVLCLSLTAAAAIRRRRILRAPGPGAQPASSTKTDGL